MAHAVIAEIDAMIADRHLLKHPFYQAWSAGALGRERLHGYAIRYYPHVAAFPRYLSAIHSRCADPATRRTLLENLIEEERGDDNHPELWLRFAEALGVERRRVLGTPTAPAVEKLIDAFAAACSSAASAAGLAAIYAYEAQMPAVAAAKIDGLKRFYGVNDERGLAFFTVHENADVWHSRTDAELIRRHCADDHAAGDAAVAAARSVLAALWAALDAM